MLVLLSDLHLTDGTAYPTLHPGAIHHLAGHLRDLACRASWRAGGGYQPVSHIDLVLMGDTLDVSASTRWLSGAERPWTADHPESLSRLAEVVDGILEHNAAGASLLRSLAHDGVIQVPAANQRGLPAYDACPVPVEVRTRYMVGNRDWMLHLPGPALTAIRQQVVGRLGLAVEPSELMPHDPAESETLQEVLRQHRVVARHGDVHDPLSYSEDRDISSIGEVLVIELITRFLQTVAESLGDDLDKSLCTALADMHHIRPLPLTPVYLDGVLARSSQPAAVKKQLRRIWDQTATAMFDLPQLKELDAWSSHDLVGGLQYCLLFRRGGGSGWESQTRAWVRAVQGIENDSFALHATAEPEFRNRRANHIVYGHTHRAEHLPLEVSWADGVVLEQSYINVGTMRKIYQPSFVSSGPVDFVPCEQMQVCAFYRDDERSGRAYEMIGSLLSAPRHGKPGGGPAPQTQAAEAQTAVRPPHFIVTTADFISQ